MLHVSAFITKSYPGACVIFPCHRMAVNPARKPVQCCSRHQRTRARAPISSYISATISQRRGYFPWHGACLRSRRFISESLIGAVFAADMLPVAVGRRREGQETSSLLGRQIWVTSRRTEAQSLFLPSFLPLAHFRHPLRPSPSVVEICLQGKFLPLFADDDCGCQMLARSN